MSREPPPSLDDRTVIRSTPAARPAPQQTPVPAEATVFLGTLPIGGWSEPTVIAAPAARPASAEPDQLFLVAPAGTLFSGPLMEHAAPVLIPLARLVANPSIATSQALLHSRFKASLREFDRATAQTGLPAGDARVARRSLAAAVDDLVGNLPGIDPAAWRKQGPLAEEGTGRESYNFFEGVNRLLGEPEPRRDLVELLHACLALGFQGQYRGRPAAIAELDQVRTDLYRHLQQLSPSANGTRGGRPPENAEPGRRFRFGVIALLGMAALLAASFGLMRNVLTSESEALRAELLALNPSGPITIEEAAAPVPAAAVAAPPSAQPDAEPVGPDALVERLRADLADEIAAGRIAVQPTGSDLAIEINNSLLFATGSASLKESFAPLGERLGKMLDEADGAVRVVGYTDNLKPSRTSPFRSNEELSAARAEAVTKALAPYLARADRLSFEGRGEADPIAGNETAEGREKNRRVVIVLSLGAGR